jgi:hypothetical protein
MTQTPDQMKTSDFHPEDQRCLFSDLPNPWCACWVHRPDVTEGIPGRTDTEEN